MPQALKEVFILIYFMPLLCNTYVLDHYHFQVHVLFPQQKTYTVLYCAKKERGQHNSPSLLLVCANAVSYLLVAPCKDYYCIPCYFVLSLTLHFLILLNKTIILNVRPFLGNEFCAVVTGVDMTMTVLVCICEVVKRGVLSLMFMIPPVGLVAVAGSDNEGADGT